MSRNRNDKRSIRYRQFTGGFLMEQLIQVARQEHISRLIAYVRVDNRGMSRLCEQFGFSVTEEADMLVATLAIPRPASVGTAETPR